MTFDDQLAIGQMGESAIAHWMRNKGYAVLPVYEKVMDTGKGPQLFLPEGCLVAPDMLVYRGERVLWLEAKYKTIFSWYGIGQKWVTGIDLRHYEDYLRVNDDSPWPVWLLFLHRDARPRLEDKTRWNCPDACPVGLFGNTLDRLRLCESHRSDLWGKSGMVYWGLATNEWDGGLAKLANLGDVVEPNMPVPNGNGKVLHR